LTKHRFEVTFIITNFNNHRH